MKTPRSFHTLLVLVCFRGLRSVRSRKIAKKRGVLREFGLELSQDVEIRVWDSTAEVRYLVLPERPTGSAPVSLFREIAQAAKLTIVLGITVMLGTSCASTGNGVSTRLISPVTNNQQVPDPEKNDLYQPARSPAFSDLLGG